MDEPSEALRCSLLLSLAEAQTASGQFPSARETLDEAAALAQELGETDALVRSAIQLGRVTEIGYADEKIIATAEAALEAVGDRDLAARAGLLSVLSTEELWRDLDRGNALAVEALEIARRAGDPDTLALAIHRSLIMEQNPEGTSDRRLELLDEMKAVADDADNAEFRIRRPAPAAAGRP